MKRKNRITEQSNDPLSALRTDKEMFQIGGIELSAMLFMIIWALIDKDAGVHSGLFSIILILLLSLIFVKSTYVDVIRLLIRVIKSQDTMKIGDWGLLFSLISVLLIPVALLFVLELSFLQGYGRQVSVTAMVLVIISIIEYVKLRFRRAKQTRIRGN